MTLWILDTDHVSLWQRQHPTVTEQIATVGLSVAMTVITAEEQLRGRLEVIRRADSAIARVTAYSRFRETLNFLKQFPQLLDFTANAEVYYEDLKRQRIRIGSQDLRIAAIALAVGGTVVTRNRRDFERVPGLSIEDWSVAR